MTTIPNARTTTLFDALDVLTGTVRDMSARAPPSGVCEVLRTIDREVPTELRFT